MATVLAFPPATPSKRDRAPRMLKPREHMTVEHTLTLIEMARTDTRNHPAMDRGEAFATLVELIRLTEGRLYRPTHLNLMRLALRFAPAKDKR